MSLDCLTLITGVAQLHASRGRYSKDLIKLTKWKESVGR